MGKYVSVLSEREQEIKEDIKKLKRLQEKRLSIEDWMALQRIVALLDQEQTKLQKERIAS